ncbi:uncharacterized protein LOC125049784 isoform X2 [Pieris napi]|uniref:uncharacterized protein LOC125049784 isoform X2 n=1 Tax=Pieris napi TaxID=78633 RepID=UPI001FB8F3DC|nr:uncharacterized protein LOC125049784 isoform X2 [Pieris napi]
MSFTENQDMSEKSQDVSVNYQDMSVKSQDVSVKYKDMSVKSQDLSVNYEDVSVNYEDMSVKSQDVSVNYQDMSVKSQDMSDEMNIVYATTLDRVPNIFNMLSQNSQDVPELVNILCTDETLSGLYNVVPTSQNLPEALDVVSTTCQETADLLDVISSQEAQEILNVVTTSHHNTDMYNIVSDPNDVSEIYIEPAPYDAYNTLPPTQTPELYQPMSSTSQLVPDTYTVLSQDFCQVSNLSCSRIDPQSIPVPTLLEVPALRSIKTKKRTTSRPKDKRSKKNKSPDTKANSKDRDKPADPIEIKFSTKRRKVKSQLIELHNGKKLLIVNEYPYYFRHVLKSSPLNRWCCNKNSCNAYVHATVDNNTVVAFGSDRHNHLPSKFKQREDGTYIKV